MSDETTINILFLFAVLSFGGFVIVFNMLRVKSKNVSRFKNLYEYHEKTNVLLKNDIEYLRDSARVDQMKINSAEQIHSANRWEIKDLKNKISEYEKIIHSGDEELADLNTVDNV